MKKLNLVKALILTITLQTCLQITPLTLHEYALLKKELDSNKRNLQTIKKIVTNIKSDLLILKEKESLSKEDVELLNYINDNFNLETLKTVESKLLSEGRLTKISKDTIEKVKQYAKNNPRKIIAASLVSLVTLALIYKDELIKTGEYIMDSNVVTIPEFQETLKTAENITEKVINATDYVRIESKKQLNNWFSKLKPKTQKQYNPVIQVSR